MDELREDLLRLQNLDDSLRGQFDELSNKSKKSWDDFWHKAAEIIQLKTNIRAEFAKSSIFVFDDDNSSSKIMLQKINSGKLLFADLVIQSLEMATNDRFDLDCLDYDELDNLASDELYRWFGPTEYIERLIEIGVLILDIHIPRELEFIVQETRQCYAFEQHIAVYSLCRTFLESAMRDICLRTGDIQKNRNPRPRALIKRLSKDDTALKKRIENLYGRLSHIAHGSKLSDSDGVQAAFKETALMVQELYEKNHSRISKFESDS